MKDLALYAPTFRFRMASVIGLAVVAALSGACKPRSSSGAKDTAIDPNRPFRGVGVYDIWAYDGGPNLQNDATREEARKLVDLNSNIPYFPGISNAVYGDQMFRPAFGPIPWRMQQEKNKVKILFIGQDGTHIAEAAGRPATAGFGGRAQDLAKHFGVSSGAAFINTYAYTIRWQYGAFDTPMVTSRADGSKQFSFGSFTGNPVWMVSQDLNSPAVKWRNQLIEWIIRNNRESLKMIVLFGGAARDAAGTFIESKGGRVGTRKTAAEIAGMKLKIAEFDLKGAGSNKQTAVPFTKEGKDLLREFAPTFRDTDYTKPEKVEALHAKFTALFNDPAQSAVAQQWINRMVLPNDRTEPVDPQDPYDAIKGSGMIHPAQLGGYDIAKKMQIGSNPEGSLSLRDLDLGGGDKINTDIIVIQLPHPTALSTMTPELASAAVNKALDAVRAKAPADWNIEPETEAIDPDTNQPLVNRYAANLGYKYGRADMGNEYYDFGSPNARMVNVSSASRSGANVIVFGTRDQPAFDEALIKKMTGAFYPSAWNGNPNPPHAEPPFSDEMWIARAIKTDGTLAPGPNNRRYTFDPGPGAEMAKIMKSNLPRNAKFTAQVRVGVVEGVEQFDSVNGDFGHYRGTFDKPEVVILADPDGDDDLITARALTGTRGQYLQGLMNDLGVGDRYLIIKTAPYSNYSDANPASGDSMNWGLALEQTADYRMEVLKKVFETATPKVILTDGPSATAEFSRLYPNVPAGAQLFAIAKQGSSNNSGIAAAGAAMIGTRLFKVRDANGTVAVNADGTEMMPTLLNKMLDIPRSHLSYYARIWEGTSGDRVITASAQSGFRGKAFAEVAPKWAFSQDFKMTESDVAGCIELINKELKYKVRLGQSGRHAETVVAYQRRMAPNSISPAPNATTLCRKFGAPVANAVAGGSVGPQAAEVNDFPLPEEPDGADDHSHDIKYAFD